MSEPLPSDQNEHYDDSRDEESTMLDAPLRDVPTRTVLKVGPGETADAVIGQMNASKTGCALVVDDGALVGIFTERDVLEKVANRQADGTAKVRDLMTPNPDTLPNDASVAFALNRMSVEGYRHIPILDEDGEPVAVMGMRDIINWMVELNPSKVLNVPPVPSSFPKTREGG